MTRRRPPAAPEPVHSDAFHVAISHELVRLSLGGRGDRRPELLVGIPGALHRVVSTTQTALADLQQRYAQRIRELGTRPDRGST